MKKLSILLLSFLFINTTIINAQNETTKEQTNSISEIKEECPTTKNEEGKLVCVKTGKECKSTCEKKATKTCCKGKKTKSTCNKSKKGSFNFNKSNNYGEVKSSCSKAEKKACSKSKESEEKKEENKNEDEESSEE